MQVWRISNHADLSGMGGKYARGRWNHLVREIVYCSDHPSTCLLEMLVRLDPEFIPESYRLLEIEIPENTNIRQVKLPENWKSQPERTRDIWEKFCEDGEAAVLKVPSSLMPQANHYLLNPLHPLHAKNKIHNVHDNLLDERFFRI